MSIIQEALKKAQTTYTEETVKTALPRRADTDAVSAAQKKRRAAIPFIKPVSAAVLLILIAGFGLNLFFSQNSAKTAKDRSHQNVSYRPVAKDAASENPSDAGLGIRVEDITSPIKRVISSGAALVSAPDFQLNGIMYIQDSPRAIINGNMVKVGGSISGARITAINKNSVLLNYNDMEITLELME